MLCCVYTQSMFPVAHRLSGDSSLRSDTRNEHQKNKGPRRSKQEQHKVVKALVYQKLAKIHLMVKRNITVHVVRSSLLSNDLLLRAIDFCKLRLKCYLILMKVTASALFVTAPANVMATSLESQNVKSTYKQALSVFVIGSSSLVKG